MYFCYVFFLTIGYGDYAPKSAAGRVFWVVYALIAVPIIASFAVQTVSNVFTAFKTARLERVKVGRGLEPSIHRHATVTLSGDCPTVLDGGEAEDSFKPFVSHSDLVAGAHEHYARRKPSDEASARGTSKAGESGPAEHPPQQQSRSEREEYLLRELIRCSVQLELQARKLLLSHLPSDSKSWLLLESDKIVQDRAVKAGSPSGDPSCSRAQDMTSGGLNDDLRGIDIYRKLYARMLVASSELQHLRGREQLLFERRSGQSDTSSSNGGGGDEGSAGEA